MIISFNFCYHLYRFWKTEKHNRYFAWVQAQIPLKEFLIRLQIHLCEGRWSNLKSRHRHGQFTNSELGFSAFWSGWRNSGLHLQSDFLENGKCNKYFMWVWAHAHRGKSSIRNKLNFHDQPVRNRDLEQGNVRLRKITAAQGGIG